MTLRKRTELVTREKASVYLGRLRKDKQRHFRIALAQRYADIQSAVRFVYTPDPVAFHIDGWLGNGRHRLEAIVVSGVPCQMEIWEGCSTDQIKAMDSWAVRSVSDRLSMAYGTGFGKHEIAATNCIAVVLGVKIVDEESVRWIRMMFGPGIDWSLSATTSELCKFAPFIAVMALGYEIDSDHTVQLVKRVMEEVPKSRSDPARLLIAALRHRWEVGGGVGSMFRMEFMRKATRAWVAEFRGESIDHLKPNSEIGIEFFRNQFPHGQKSAA